MVSETYYMTEREKLIHFEVKNKLMKGGADNFTIWQRVNFELTGETIAFLPK